jgi:GNAT superfamily N-acetyltransferase
VNDTLDLTIAPALVEDVPTILRLIRALGAYEELTHEIVATEDELRRWLFGDKPAAEVLVARVGSDAIGFALFFQNFSTFLARPGLYLEDLFVVPEWRGRGVGRRLLATLASLAVARGCGRFEWSVLEWNTPAIEFYRRAGAVVMDDWRICRVTGAALTALAARR